jgi:hypothetical protein
MTWANLGLSYSTRRGPSSFGPRKVNSYPCSAFLKSSVCYATCLKFLPLKSSKNIEKSSFRFGSTTTRRELPILDFAFAKLNRATPNNKALFRKNMWQSVRALLLCGIPRRVFICLAVYGNHFRQIRLLIFHRSKLLGTLLFPLIFV